MKFKFNNIAHHNLTTDLYNKLVMLGYKINNLVRINEPFHLSAGLIRTGFGENTSVIINYGEFVTLAATLSDMNAYGVGEMVYIAYYQAYPEMGSPLQTIRSLDDSIDCLYHLECSQIYAYNKSLFRKATREEIHNFYSQQRSQRRLLNIDMDVFTQEGSHPGFSSARQASKTAFFRDQFNVADKSKNDKLIAIIGTNALKNAFLSHAKSQFKGKLKIGHKDNMGIYFSGDAWIIVNITQGIITAYNPGKLYEGSLEFNLGSQWDEAFKAINEALKPQDQEAVVRTADGEKKVIIKEDVVFYNGKYFAIDNLINIEKHLSQAEGVMIGTGIRGKASFTFGCKKELPFVSVREIQNILNQHRKSFPSYYEKTKS
jgi:hypothetical protein